MVARILSGYSIRGLLNYNEAKVEDGHAILILANHFAVEVEKLELKHKIARFEKLTKLNGRARRNAMHIILNFDRADKLSQDKMVAVASEYMNGIGFGEQPYLVYQHQDVSHPHIHIVSTNIKADGSRIDFHNIGKYISEMHRKNIELKYGLAIAQGKTGSIEEKIKTAVIKAVSYGKKPTKQSIYNVITPVIRSYAFTTLAELNAILNLYNVTADRGKEDSVMYERHGLIYSIVDTQGVRIGVPIKASALGGKPTLRVLETKFLANQIKRKATREPLKKTIDLILENKKVVNKEDFILELRKENIDLVFRRASSGQIYGLTYVDHNRRSVFNGSDLGKNYTAKSVLERFDTTSIVSARSSAPTNGIQSPAMTLLNGHKEKTKLFDSKVELLETLLDRPPFEPSDHPITRKKRKKKHRSQTIK